MFPRFLPFFFFLAFFSSAFLNESGFYILVHTCDIFLHITSFHPSMFPFLVVVAAASSFYAPGKYNSTQRCKLDRYYADNARIGYS